MAKYSTFFYGTGVFYGPSASLTSIDPDSGPSTGGVAYTATGSGFLIDTYNDDFSGVALDAGKWNSLDSGSGSLSTGNPNLILNTGATAGSYSGVETVNTFGSCQFKIKAFLGPLTSYPSATVELLSFISYVDANNYAKMSVQVGSISSTLKLVCEVYVAGSLVDSHEVSTWSLGYSTFKIARFDKQVFFSANGSQIYSSRSFVSTASKYRIYSYNGSSTYSVRTRVDYFVEKTYVMFGGFQMDAEPTVVSETRLRGLTPPSLDNRDQEAAFKGTVDIYIINSAITVYGADAYEYFYLDRFKALRSNQENVTLSIVNDNQVKTPDNKIKGN